MARTHPHTARWILPVLLAFVLAGCTGGSVTLPQPTPAPGTPSAPVSPAPATAATSPSAVPAEPSGVPQPRTINPDQLLSAPVPSLCGHPAGRLVQGKLPGIAAGQGQVEITGVEKGDWPTRSVRTFDAGGRTYALVVFTCNAGGVAWPARVVVYDDAIAVVKAFDLASVIGEGRQSVEALENTPQGVVLRVVGSFQEGDPGCCGSKDARVQVSVTDGVATAAVTATYTEKATAVAVLKAVKTKDAATVKRLTSGQARTWASEGDAFLDGKARVIRCTRPNWPDLPPSVSRMCVYGTEGVYVMGLIGLERTGFAEWRATYLTEFTTD